MMSNSCCKAMAAKHAIRPMSSRLVQETEGRSWLQKNVGANQLTADAAMRCFSSSVLTRSSPILAGSSLSMPFANIGLLSKTQKSNTRQFHSSFEGLYKMSVNGSGINGVINSSRQDQQHQAQEKQQSTPTASSSSSSSSLQKEKPEMIRGISLDHAVDLRTVQVGDVLEIPYELTLTETLQDFWFASFFDQSRIHTSRPFCRAMGLQDRVVPFWLALFLTSSMSHADAAKVQVGFGAVHYLWPLFSGDTVKRTFKVKGVRNTSDGNHSVIYFQCDLKNQRGRLCMRADKRLLFQFPVQDATSEIIVDSLNDDDDEDGIDDGSGNTKKKVDLHLFRDHLLSKATASVLSQQSSHSLTRLEKGQLILHTLHRCLTFSQSQQLASLARLTHSRHFDIRRYDRNTEILIPGGLVLGLTVSATARDLHEILHEEIQSASYNNTLHPESDMVGAISYVHSVEQDSLPGDLELITVTTLGIKNVHVRTELDGVDLPLSLFRPGIYAKEMEQICKESCPLLSNRIVVSVTRRVVRQSNHRQVFLL